jgi:hypothetical protein
MLDFPALVASRETDWAERRPGPVLNQHVRPLRVRLLGPGPMNRHGGAILSPNLARWDVKEIAPANRGD